MRTSTYFGIATALLLSLSKDINAQENNTNEHAQEPRTLFGGNGKIKHGGWGAPTASYTQVMKQDAMLVGLRGGWLINHRLTIGVAGQGMVTPLTNKAYEELLIAEDGAGLSTSRFNMGYGGLLIEPVISYKSPIHISLPIIIGAGGCGYTTSTRSPGHDEWFEWDEYDYRNDSEAFFVLEPGIDLEMNVIPLLRFGIGASYRYTTEVDLPATAKDALHGITAGFSIKVGKF
ncbi:MAG: hypothetical protein WAR83_07145 [Flavobacteriales bacterium]